MSLTKNEIYQITKEFVLEYPVSLNLAFIIRDSTKELYGNSSDLVPSDMKGAYISKETEHNGKKLLGQVHIPANNIESKEDYLTTLRHEIIGHFGFNTFSKDEQNNLIEGIVRSKDEPTLQNNWNVINKLYSDQSLEVKAQELFAKYCESITPAIHKNSKNMVIDGQNAFYDTCVDMKRLMTSADLLNIAGMVADGLHTRTREQKTFPDIHEFLKREKSMNAKKPYHEVVAEKIIEQLKAGTAPWQKPWEVGNIGFMPMNPTTGNRYKGINAIHLMAQGRDDTRWLTYNQAKDVGAQVKRGEKGTQVQYWKFNEEQNKLDENGKPVLNEEGKPQKILVKLERPKVFFATVFNAEQIDGLPPLEIKENNWNAIERAEQILKNSGAKINHSNSDNAFYRPSTDSIHLPEKEQFPTADNYYATALHELGHWTGHPSRLNRDLANPFGSEAYAKEELRAEIASMILGDELGIGHNPEQHAAYVGSWIKALQEDSLEIFRAAADAEKIQNYVMNLELKLNQEESITQSEKVSEMNTEMDDFDKKYTVIDGVNKSKVLETNSAIKAYEISKNNEGSVIIDNNIIGDNEINLDEMNNNFYQTLNAEKIAIDKGIISLNDEVNVLPPSEASEWYQSKIEEIMEGEESPEAVLKAIESLGPEPQSNDTIFLSKKGERIFPEEHTIEVKNDDFKGKNILINVPYKERNEAKELGAKWDRKQQSWYIPSGVKKEGFDKWLTSDSTTNPIEKNKEVKYLAVPYEEKDAAKAAGALWDKAAKSWYMGPEADVERLKRWLPENTISQQNPAMTPREEFSETLKAVGCVVDGNHPIMDGKKHRISVEGDKNGEKAGFYVGHLDGHPAGYIKNNRTGIDIKWKSKGYTLDPAQKAKIQAEAAEKLAQRAIEQEKVLEQTSARLINQADSLTDIKEKTPYLKNKDINVHKGVLTDSEGTTTYIPAYDVNGKQWTMQYIQEDGTKRFAKDSKKEGCFHVIGGQDKLNDVPVIIISEGYATAASNSEALGIPTVAAFDSGNLLPVAKALNEKYPDKQIVILGDDDRHLEITQGVNAGKVKAQEAANAVNGKAIFPIFAPGENDYPKDLEKITPQKYREHLNATKLLENAPIEQVEELKKQQLTEEQLSSLSKMKLHTDFNDLATKSELGKEGLKRQVKNSVEKIIKEKVNKLNNINVKEIKRSRGARI